VRYRQRVISIGFLTVLAAGPTPAQQQEPARQQPPVQQPALQGESLPAEAQRGTRWREEDFYRKAREARPYELPLPNPGGVPQIVGRTRTYHVRDGDTFLDVARYYGLGFNEIKGANRNVDEWVPPQDSQLSLPTEWIVPGGEQTGIVINIPEMRLYYFHPRKPGETGLVTTYPVGLGRDEWRTPQGRFKVTERSKCPKWVIPDSIQKERQAQGDFTKFIDGCDPENPLGEYRLRLSLDLYGIHGTNIPWGVGMQVSHGCIRLYPEDIEQLYPIIPEKTAGEFIYEPVKIGMREGRVYAQVHDDIYKLKPALFSEAKKVLQRYNLLDRVDMTRLVKVVLEQTGVVTDISIGNPPGPPAPLQPAGNPLREGLKTL